MRGLEVGMNDRDLGKAAVVEFLGPFALVFAGVGTILATQGQNLLAIALAHGLAIGLMITAAGHISGGHFNPAVTIGMLLTGKINAVRAVVYIIVQVAGAVAAALVLAAVYPPAGALGRDNPGINFGVVAVHPEATLLGAFIVELVMTFFLVWVIFGTAVDWRSPKAVTGLAIGLTITIDILLGGVISGGAMNPARALGPAIVQGDFTDIWLWIVAPVVGGGLAAFIYQFVLLTGVPGDPPPPHVTAVQQDPIDDPNVPRTVRDATRGRDG